MHKLVREYLARKDREALEKRQEYKRKVLEELGIYEKAYPIHEDFDYEEFPYWDEEQQKRCKKICVDVTDEEFAEIEKRYNASEKKMESGLYRNVGQRIMNYAIGWFWLGLISGIITGFVMMGNDMILGGLLTIFGGSLACWVTSWFVYAYGQLVEDTHVMRGKMDEE